MTTTILDTAVIGAGAAGLHAARLLAERGIRYEVFDEHERVGDSWRERYRSLHLFTPRPLLALPGLTPPVGPFSYPTGAQMGDYLEHYARAFGVPVRCGCRVVRLSRQEQGFRLELDGEEEVLARRVVVAGGAHRVPVVPALASSISPRTRQLHSVAYRGPEQLADGAVLVVGFGNSGSDIALEAARAGHRVWIAGRVPGQLPARIDNPLANLVARRIVRRLARLTLDTPQGRAARDAQAGHGIMLIRNKAGDLEKAGIRHVGRVERVDGGLPVADGQPIQAGTIVWCTGSRADVDWIDIDGVVVAGEPVHVRGLATACPGLGFVGLDFQYSAASSTLAGMAADARHVVDALLAHEPQDAVAAAS